LFPHLTDSCQQPWTIDIQPQIERQFQNNLSNQS